MCGALVNGRKLLSNHYSSDAEAGGHTCLTRHPGLCVHHKSRQSFAKDPSHLENAGS